MTEYPNITRKTLIDWAGAQVLRDAESMLQNGLVLEARYEPPYIVGSVRCNNRPLETSLKILPDGSVENLCSCWANTERGLVCPHVIALALCLVMRATDPQRDEKYKAELRRASRLAAVDEALYIRRAAPDTPGAIPAELAIRLDENWRDGFADNAVTLRCSLNYKGQSVPLDDAPRNLPFSLGKQDEALLFVLDDICEGPARSLAQVGRTDFLNILKLRAGSTFMLPDGSAASVNMTPVPTHIRMELDEQSGELALRPHTELPFSQPGEVPLYLVHGRSGWVFGATNFWPLEKTLPEPYHAMYSGAVRIPRNDVLRFMTAELPVIESCARIESDISTDLFTVEPATPSFRIVVVGSPASLAATLYAKYGDIELVAGRPDAKGHFGLPDPRDVMRYLTRNSQAEKDALQTLARAGMTGELGDDLEHLVGERKVLNFLGGALPALRRRGWQVELQGKIGSYMDSTSFVVPVVEIGESPASGWFDVGFRFEGTDGSRVSQSDIQLAIRKGDSYVERGDRAMLIDSDAVSSMYDVFNDCASGDSDTGGRFRMSSVYAPFVKNSLDSLDGVDIESPQRWRSLAEKFGRVAPLEPVQLGTGLDSILRPYQKDGVNWLVFLERNGFCGLLADEMGLGKTVQTLAWLQLQRANADAQNKPALIVCPTSIVENWAEEAARFTPGMKVVVLSGPERHALWTKLPESDLAIASYAILRRDIEKLSEQDFSVAVLDEAQHIKNRATQNAVAAKTIQSRGRLVLTGTPMENSVSDLWSIMDFLMPGYLGSHEAFKQNYELPITRERPDSAAARTKLRRKLHPFMLRRLKSEVARDLPPKIEKISFCALTEDQKSVYKQILRAARPKISALVSQRGFGGARMEILTVLMRLRQVCCHLGLLKLTGAKPENPSAKLDLFLELVDEAMDSGHRILVFSQFVSMLEILKEELDRREIRYCYLVGATKDRMKIVREFNTSREIPIFLISLKAGGTGLNLTGADMVIHFDPWWNPAVENQATDRAYRIGQKRTVYGIKLIARGTVEEKVLELQHRKKEIIEDMIESAEGIPRSMTWDDVQNLLEL